MVFWRIYKHHCRYQHNVEDNSELIDKACLVPHQHGFSPNDPVCIEFILLTKKWIDFKTIKLIAIDCVEKLANTNGVAADILYPAFQLPTDGLPYYDFGTADTETLVDDLRKLFLASLPKRYNPAKLQIWMDETNKFSVWEDGTEWL